MKLNQLLFSGLSRWIKSQLETLREVSHNPKCPIFQNTMVSNKIFGIEYKAPPTSDNPFPRQRFCLLRQAHANILGWN